VPAHTCQLHACVGLTPKCSCMGANTATAHWVCRACLQESGAYDAFETTLEILRMRVAHPGADPATYASLDPAYAAFMECRGAPAVATVPEGAVHKPGGEQQNTGGSDGAAQGSAGDKASDVPGAQQAADGAAKAVLPVAGSAAAKRSRKRKAPVKRTPGLCSLSWFESEPPPCYFCQDPHEQMVPGGSACCWAENLSLCPRVWT
jgi:hypothetical protein